MKAERQKIYDKTGGKCYYCGCKLQKFWHKDHVIPIRRLGEWVKANPEASVTHVYKQTGEVENPDADTFENLVPSCPRCNMRKDTMDIETFRLEIQAQVDRLKRDSNQFRLALDYGLIEITDKDVEFYFEKKETA